MQPVPRHNEINERLARKILQTLLEKDKKTKDMKKLQ